MNDNYRVDPRDARRLRIGLGLINEALRNIAHDVPGTEVRIEHFRDRLGVVLHWPRLNGTWIF